MVLLGLSVGVVMAVLFALAYLVYSMILGGLGAMDNVAVSLLVLVFALPFGLAVGAGSSFIVWSLARWMHRWSSRATAGIVIVVVCLVLSGASWVGLNLMLSADQPMDWLGTLQWIPGPLMGGLVGGGVLSRYVVHRWTR